MKYRRLLVCAESGNQKMYNRIANEVDCLAANIAGSQPETLTGIKAKARVAFLFWFGLDGEMLPVGEECLVAATLIRDLAGMNHVNPNPRLTSRVPFRVIHGGREEHR